MSIVEDFPWNRSSKLKVCVKKRAKFIRQWLFQEKCFKMDIECAVCLQPSIHPVRLPCNHIFCFLCVKGVTIQSQRCPMCRREIPPSYLEHPALVNPESNETPSSTIETASGQLESQEEATAEEDFKWFYQGRNGWWEYDERTAQELEHHHKKGDKSCELLIAGFLYSIDLENMLQCRRNEPHRRRQIKRDLSVNVADKKGVAGIRTAVPPPSTVDDLTDQVSSINLQDQANDDDEGPNVEEDN